jgi:TatD DNase family protein
VLIDTHCHLADPVFDNDRAGVLERAHAAGVERLLIIESELTRVDATAAWVASEPTLALACACHPHDASKWSADIRALLQNTWQHAAVRAVGEIGLDYHYDHAPRDVQQHVFAEQLALAVTAGMPVIIHAREADDDIVAILRNEPAATIVLHSFSSGTALRDAGLAAGWYFSFSGMVTFKSWTQADTVRAVPLERLLIETDAPYLAPVPHRGKRNEPALVADTARRVAALRDITPDALAAATTANALRLFWPAS